MGSSPVRGFQVQPDRIERLQDAIVEILADARAVFQEGAQPLFHGRECAHEVFLPGLWQVSM